MRHHLGRVRQSQAEASYRAGLPEVLRSADVNPRRMVGTPESKLSCQVCRSTLLGNYEAIAHLGAEVGNQRFGDEGEAVIWKTKCPRCGQDYLVTAPERA